MGDAPEPERVYCTACGEAISAADRFCAYCGEPVKRRDRNRRDRQDRNRQGRSRRGADERQRDREPRRPPGERRRPRQFERRQPREPSGRRHRSRRRRDSPLRAVGVAAGLGVLGVFALGVTVLLGLFVGLLAGLPLLVAVGLAFVAGHLVGFVALAVVYLASRGYDARRIRSYLGIRWPTGRELGLVVAGNLLIAVLLGVFLGLVELFALLPAEDGTGQDELEGFGVGVYVVAVLFMLLLVGPTEEVLYRGVVQNRLREQFGVVPAVGIASAIFTAIHIQIFVFGGGPVGIAVGFLALFIPSVVLGALYEYTGNVVVPSLVHGIHNSLVVTALFFGPSVVADLLTF